MVHRHRKSWEWQQSSRSRFLPSPDRAKPWIRVAEISFLQRGVWAQSFGRRATPVEVVSHWKEAPRADTTGCFSANFRVLWCPARRAWGGGITWRKTSQCAQKNEHLPCKKEGNGEPSLQMILHIDLEQPVEHCTFFPSNQCLPGGVSGQSVGLCECGF